MKIIFYSSHTNVWYFALAEAALAAALQNRGHEVLFITPGNLFLGISNLQNERILRSEFGLKGYEIGEILTSQDYKEINSIVKKTNQKNFEKIIINGINIGKMALYEFLIERKKMDLKFTRSEWNECLSAIKNTLISFYACRKILQKEKPDRVLIYNAIYSVNHVWQVYANFKEVPVYFLHNGANFSDMDDTLIIGRDSTFNYSNSLKEKWSKFKNTSVNKEMVSYVTDHFLELLKGRHFLAYSSPKSEKTLNIRKKFGIDENQKILTATMSSYDEMFAAEYVGVWQKPKKLLFKNQTDWVKSLIEYVKNREDLFLIIRVHPREFPNKREGVRSQHSRMLEDLFKKLPDNVKINWPTDKISIYDLAEETSVFLNAWSTVGVEMSLLGIPVVIYSKDLIRYPSELNYVGESKSKYFAQIELALKNGWSYEKIKKTYRWLSLYYYQTVIRLRSKKTSNATKEGTNYVFNFTNYFYTSLSPRTRFIITKWMPKSRYNNHLISDCKKLIKEKIDTNGLEKMLKNRGDSLVGFEHSRINKATIKDEEYAIKKEVTRIYKALYGELNSNINTNHKDLRYSLEMIIK